MVPKIELPFFSFLSFLLLVLIETHLKQLKHDLEQESSKKEVSKAEKENVL